MQFVDHPSTNFTFKAPAGQEDHCGDLKCKREYNIQVGSMTTTSFWKPNPEEMDLIARGKPITLTIFGEGHPMVSIGVDGWTGYRQTDTPK